MPTITLRLDWDAVRVRDAGRLAEDAGQARRLLAIAAVYDGMSRAAARWTEIFGLSITIRAVRMQSLTR